MALVHLRQYRVFGRRLLPPLGRPGGSISYPSSTREDPVLLTCYQRHLLPVFHTREQSTSAVVDGAKPDMSVVGPWTVGQSLPRQTMPPRMSDFKVNNGDMDILKTKHTLPEALTGDHSCSVRPTDVALKKEGNDRFWANIPLWSDVGPEDFISQYWQVRHSVDKKKIERFLLAVLPSGTFPPAENPLLQHIRTKHDFIQEAKAALDMAPMTIKLSPYVLSCINWSDPLNDPVRLQFVPLKSNMIPDHPSLTLDSLDEEGDSPVPGLVHRYPGKVLFLSTSICPVYCSFCTRAYAVGPETDSTNKKPQKPSKERWELMFEYIEKDKSIQDVVVSGGDTYMLAPEHLRYIGERLLSIDHIRRFRIASKGLAVNPCRILDKKDAWANTLVDLAKQGRKLGKQVCWHTHFNHPNEITWITKEAALRLCQEGLVIRNQTVLLKGVNDAPDTMGALIKTLADMNIEPYYVYICDLIRGVEHLRTPLQTLLKLDKQLRGTLTGFMMPDFVVDLPGGGGKRLAHTFESYDETTGVSTWRAPGLPGDKGQKTYTYYDPFPWKATEENILQMREVQNVMHKCRSTRLEDIASSLDSASTILADQKREAISPQLCIPGDLPPPAVLSGVGAA